jgi:hypothetical protein
LPVLNHHVKSNLTTLTRLPTAGRSHITLCKNLAPIIYQKRSPSACSTYSLLDVDPQFRRRLLLRALLLVLRPLLFLDLDITLFCLAFILLLVVVRIVLITLGPRMASITWLTSRCLNGFTTTATSFASTTLLRMQSRSASLYLKLGAQFEHFYLAISQNG